MSRPNYIIYVFLTLVAILSTLHIGVRTFVVEVLAQESEEYQGPEFCITCHPRRYEEWNSTSHSRAYINQEFQAEWISIGSSDECLQCHTTGYDPATGSFIFEGVTCEQCHGPGMTMDINASSELCGSCHTGEYGRHMFEEFQEGTHRSAGVKCADCHMHEESHTFELESKACAKCHPYDDIHNRRWIPDLQTRILEEEDKLSQLQEANLALQSKLEGINRRSSQITLISLGGAAAIIVLSTIVVVIYLRQR